MYYHWAHTQTGVSGPQGRRTGTGVLAAGLTSVEDKEKREKDENSGVPTLNVCRFESRRRLFLFPPPSISFLSHRREAQFFTLLTAVVFRVPFRDSISKHATKMIDTSSRLR